MLTVNRRSHTDKDVRPISHLLLLECQRAKERLSYSELAEIEVTNPETHAVLRCALTRVDFEHLLTKHHVYAHISKVVRRALHRAHEVGYGRNEIKTVLMVGGGSHIPSVQLLLQHQLDCRVTLTRPLTAVATGAAMLAAGLTLCDHIQHDYSIRHVNPKRGDYEYHYLIRRGTRYPTPGPVARMTIKASHSGQRHLGLAIMEMGEGPGEGCSEPIEILYDILGAVQVATLTREQCKARRIFCMNEHALVFLTAEPPARYEGEARFTVEFSVDKNKHLLITAHDLETGMVIYKDYPVVELT